MAPIDPNRNVTIDRLLLKSLISIYPVYYFGGDSPQADQADHKPTFSADARPNF
ncbi:MAG: hypothetical protein MH252_03665 [Thermosynechococcaceae cyanobacterium MS004]|nr:hypothetical protein [Thermosynechococcaceae cyanobacterium MS004]